LLQGDRGGPTTTEQGGPTNGRRRTRGLFGLHGRCGVAMELQPVAWWREGSKGSWGLGSSAWCAAHKEGEHSGGLFRHGFSMAVGVVGEGHCHDGALSSGGKEQPERWCCRPRISAARCSRGAWGWVEGCYSSDGMAVSWEMEER